MRKKLCALLIVAVMIMLCPLSASASEVCNHDWIEWERLREPTCGQIGMEGRFCKRCAKTEYIQIPATGKHTWGSWSVSKAATVNKTGTQKRICTECNTSQTKKIAKLKPFVKLSKKTINLQVSKTYTLKPKYAKGDSIKKYKSSNTKVATVSKTGKIKAKRKGTAKITITAKSGKKVTCTVKVTPKKKST